MSGDIVFIGDKGRTNFLLRNRQLTKQEVQYEDQISKMTDEFQKEKVAYKTRSKICQENWRSMNLSDKKLKRTGKYSDICLREA